MRKRFLVTIHGRTYTVHVEIGTHEYEILGAVDAEGREVDPAWLEQHYLELHELLMDRIVDRFR